MKIACFTALAVIVFITNISCSKTDNVINIPGPQENLISYNLKPYYPKHPDAFNSKYELIISTSNGKILLDTVTDINTSTPLSFKSPESRVNVTTIGYNKQLSKYEIQTYKGVNPNQWDTLSFGLGHRMDLNPGNLVSSTLTYNNVPHTTGMPYLNSYASYLGSGYFLSYSEATINAEYYKCANTPVYLLLPSSGLYSLNYPAKNPDTINIQKMDTAVQVKFQGIKDYNIAYVDLLGLVDSTDIFSVNYLYNSPAIVHNNTVNADLLYPGKYFQTYQLTLSVFGNSQGVSHFSYGDSVRTVLNLPDKSNYNITSSSYDKFAVQFLNTAPAYYSTTWNLDNIQWTIFASPDSSAIMPFGMMNALQAKSFYLKSLNLNNLKLTLFTFENMKNIDFDTYLNFTFNSMNRKKRLIYYSDIYSIGF
ncbi:MAG: hypothetical protein QM768_03360 [Agriterribacter sp.]